MEEQGGNVYYPFYLPRFKPTWGAVNLPTSVPPLRSDTFLTLRESPSHDLTTIITDMLLALCVLSRAATTPRRGGRQPARVQGDLRTEPAARGQPPRVLPPR